MDALTRHCFLAAESSRIITRRASSYTSSSKALSSSWIRFLEAPRKIGSVGCPIFLERKSIRSIPPSSSSEGDGNTADSQIQTAFQSNTVHVKFALHKACLFGEQFLLVGDDPMFGLWEPSSAIPLEWSDGDVWTTELDLPIGKSIQFKFILLSLSRDIHWQPGPDRILQIWETTNTIVVSEDWENAENQKITVEEPLAILAEEVISTENMVGSNGRAVSDENRRMGMIDETQRSMTGDNLSQSMNDEKQLVSYDEGDLRLVPGLAPIPVSGTASVFSKEVLNGNMVDDLHALPAEAEHCNTSQQGEPKPEVLNHDLLAEETLKLSEKPHDDDTEETLSYDDELSEGKLQAEEPDFQSTSGILRNDIHWGRKTLHQLLLNLGFSMKPSPD